MFRRKRSTEGFAEEIKVHLELETDELRRGLERGSGAANCSHGVFCACARDWREHGGLQRDERGATAGSAGGRSGSPGVFEDFQPSSRYGHHRFQ
jgi:hypothetical protein